MTKKENIQDSSRIYKNIMELGELENLCLNIKPRFYVYLLSPKNSNQKTLKIK